MMAGVDTGTSDLHVRSLTVRSNNETVAKCITLGRERAGSSESNDSVRNANTDLPEMVIIQNSIRE